MRLVYTYHSGFYVEFENKVLVFDNIDDDLLDKLRGIRDKHLYVFVTHLHNDHYDENIWLLDDEGQEVTYIFGEPFNKEGHNVVNIRPDEKIILQDVEIKTTDSTDRGVSFLVKTEGKNIYHAGDLNWWHWKNDSTETQKKEEEDYKTEIMKLKGEEIDIAMVPVDPRLDEHYYLAGEFFIKEIHPKYFLPMHFGNDLEITKKFKKHMDSVGADNTKIFTIESKYQEYSFY